MVTAHTPLPPQLSVLIVTAVQCEPPVTLQLLYKRFYALHYLRHRQQQTSSIVRQ